MNIYIVYCLTLCAMLFWGLSFVWIKIVYEYLSPLSMVFIRLFLAATVLSLILKVMRKGDSIRRKDYRWLMLLAFFEPFCYFLGESFGMLYVSSTVAAIVISTIPVFAPFFARFFLNERITLFNVIGLVLSFIGVLSMVLDRHLKFQAELKGLLLLFAAVFSAIFYGLVLKRLSHTYSSLTIVKWQNILGAFYFLPLFIIFDHKNFLSIIPDFRLISTMTLLAIFPSTLAFVFITVAYRHLGINRTNVFTNIIPLFTAVFSFFILHEKFDLYKILGMVLILSGVFISQIQKRRTVQQESADVPVLLQ